jgi:hypothetical protein
MIDLSALPTGSEFLVVLSHLKHKPLEGPYQSSSKGCGAAL